MRPDHRMVGHTAFLVYSRRLAPGYPHPPNAAVLRRALTVRTTPARAHPPPLGRSNRRALEILQKTYRVDYTSSLLEGGLAMIDDPRSDELGQIRAELAKQRANNERLTATLREARVKSSRSRPKSTGWPSPRAPTASRRPCPIVP